MDIRVVYKQDKTVAIIHPAPKSKRSYEKEKEWLDRIFTKAMSGELEGLPFDDMDPTLLPSEEDRDCWEGEKGKGVYTNKEKKQVKDRKKLIDGEISRIKKVKDDETEAQAIINLGL